MSYSYFQKTRFEKIKFFKEEIYKNCKIIRKPSIYYFVKLEVCYLDKKMHKRLLRGKSKYLKFHSMY